MTFFVFIDGREFGKERVIIFEQRGAGFEECLTPFCRTTAKAGEDVGNVKFIFVFRKSQMAHTDVQLGLLQKWVKLGRFPIKGRRFADFGFLVINRRRFGHFRRCWRVVLSTRRWVFILKGSKALAEEAIFLFEDVEGFGFGHHLDAGRASGRNSGGTMRKGSKSTLPSHHAQKARAGCDDSDCRDGRVEWG